MKLRVRDERMEENQIVFILELLKTERTGLKLSSSKKM